MKPRSNVNSFLFMKKLTPESSYILGLLWADGYISPKYYGIRLEALYEDVQNYIPIFDKTGKWLYYITPASVKYKRNSKKKGIIWASNKKLNMWLRQYNYLPNKFKNATIINLIPDNLKHFWFRGLIDGDGSWCFGPSKKGPLRKFVIAGPYKQEWVFFEQLLKELNISYKTSRYLRKTGNYSCVTITNKNNLQKLGNYVYQDYDKDKIGLSRKYNKWTKMMETYGMKSVDIFD